jgi:alkanesulfonate monooxygenase SsuD/methylene tetrahydromethanopterin reductase-like flavin-dependent oxidoreductase (luciferase family)
LTALEAAVPRIQDRLAALNPPPVRRMPLLIAGRGAKRTLRLVARYADAWHATFPERPDELEPTVAALRRWCEVEGRDPADIEWSVGVEPDDLERFFAEDAATYLTMGFTQFTLGFQGPDWAVDRGAHALAWRDRMNQDRAAPAPATVGA